MATVYMRGGRWYAGFKTPAGKWSYKTTTAKTKDEAKRLADDLEHVAWLERNGLGPTAEVVQFLESLLRLAAPALLVVDELRKGPLSDAERERALASFDAFLAGGGGVFVGRSEEVPF